MLIVHRFLLAENELMYRMRKSVKFFSLGCSLSFAICMHGRKGKAGVMT